MKEVDQLFMKYGESHQNKINKAIHWIAVPSIVFSLVGLLWSIPFPAIPKIEGFVNWAAFVIAFSLYYYYRLSPALAYAMLLLIFLFIFLIVQIEGSGYALWKVSAIIFVVAWIFQFIGHKIEGKKPSFLDDLKFLLIGPLWLMHFLFKKWNIPY